MSDKAAKKKQFILDTARVVFCNKGYKDVTMKDIVEACEISRGGLYIYFDSTESIFKEILESEISSLPKSCDDNYDTSAGDLLALFLNEQKKEILNVKDELSVAIYEYMFAKHAQNEPETVVTGKLSDMTVFLQNIIDKGVASGEFYADDSFAVARNIMYTLAGLKIAAKTVGVTEKDVDNELVYLMCGLIAEE